MSIEAFLAAPNVGVERLPAALLHARLAWGLERRAWVRDIAGKGIMGALPLRHSDGLCQEGST